MDEEFDQINVIPLVDVMLVLLAIVLTTATFVVNGHIPVGLAKSPTAEVMTLQAPVVVTLTQQNQLYVNDDPVTDLKAALKPFALESQVAIRADGQVALERFVKLSDQVKGLGFTQVSLEVRRQ